MTRKQNRSSSESDSSDSDESSGSTSQSSSSSSESEASSDEIRKSQSRRHKKPGKPDVVPTAARRSRNEKQEYSSSDDKARKYNRSRPKKGGDDIQSDRSSRQDRGETGDERVRAGKSRRERHIDDTSSVDGKSVSGSSHPKRKMAGDGDARGYRRGKSTQNQDSDVSDTEEVQKRSTRHKAESDDQSKTSTSSRQRKTERSGGNMLGSERDRIEQTRSRESGHALVKQTRPRRSRSSEREKKGRRSLSSERVVVKGKEKGREQKRRSGSHETRKRSPRPRDETVRKQKEMPRSKQRDDSPVESTRQSGRRRKHCSPSPENKSKKEMLREHSAEPSPEKTKEGRQPKKSVDLSPRPRDTRQVTPEMRPASSEGRKRKRRKQSSSESGSDSPSPERSQKSSKEGQKRSKPRKAASSSEISSSRSPVPQKRQKQSTRDQSRSPGMVKEKARNASSSPQSSRSRSPQVQSKVSVVQRKTRADSPAGGSRSRSSSVEEARVGQKHDLAQFQSEPESGEITDSDADDSKVQVVPVKSYVKKPNSPEDRRPDQRRNPAVDDRDGSNNWRPAARQRRGYDRDGDNRRETDRGREERDRNNRRDREDSDRNNRRERDRDTSSRKRRADEDQSKPTEAGNQPEETETGAPAVKKPKPTPMGAEALTGRTGGAYIPPAKLRAMQASITDKTSEAYQRISWEALKKSINGLINKVNVSNIIDIVRELFQENIVRGRGLMARSIIQAQSASPTFTHVYAALVAIINTKFPQNGELILRRLINLFRRGFKRNDKTICLSATRFIAHLVNQQVAHEVLALEILTLLLETPTDDSVEVSIGFLKECGQKLTEVSPRGINAIFERLRNVLHEGLIDTRVQYMVEVMFAVRKDGFKDHPSVLGDLDLVEEEDQFTHLLTLEDAGNPEDLLNVFRADPDFQENEEKYKVLKKEILDEGSSDEGSGSGSGSDSDSEAGEEEEDEEAKQTIIDKTETNLVALRRTIYLTIQSSLDYQECAHKLLKMELKPGQEVELCNMILDCCAQTRTYEKFFGLLAQRFCMIDRKYVDPLQNIFKEQYDTIHRLETNKLRNVAKFFSHLLHTDAINWGVLSCIKLNEEDTTSASRIFIKILFQDLSEYMGLPKLNDRLKDPSLQEFFVGVMPRDNPRDTRFAINFFTTIGLGGLTDDLRDHLKNMSKKLMQQKQMEAEAAVSDSDSSSSESESNSDSDSSDDSSSDSGVDKTDSSESSDSEEERNKKKRKRKAPEKGKSGKDRSKRTSNGEMGVRKQRSKDRDQFTGVNNGDIPRHRREIVESDQNEKRAKGKEISRHEGRKRKDGGDEGRQRKVQDDGDDNRQRKGRYDSDDNGQRKVRDDSDSADNRRRKARNDGGNSRQKKVRDDSDSEDRRQRKGRYDGDSDNNRQRKGRYDGDDKKQRKARYDSGDDRRQGKARDDSDSADNRQRKARNVGADNRQRKGRYDGGDNKQRKARYDSGDDRRQGKVRYDSDSDDNKQRKARYDSDSDDSDRNGADRGSGRGDGDREPVERYSSRTERVSDRDRDSRSGGRGAVRDRSSRPGRDSGEREYSQDQPSDRDVYHDPWERKKKTEQRRSGRGYKNDDGHRDSYDSRISKRDGYRDNERVDYANGREDRRRRR